MHEPWYLFYSCDPDPEGGCLPPGQQHHSEQRTQRQGAHRVDTHSYTHIYSCYQRHFSEGGSEEACYIVVKINIFHTVTMFVITISCHHGSFLRRYSLTKFVRVVVGYANSLSV